MIKPKNRLWILIILCLITITAAAQQYRPPKPPEAAFSACANVQNEAGCSFSAPHGQITGVCRTPPGESRLVCMPERAGRDRDRANRQSEPVVSDRQRPGNLRSHTVVQTTAKPTLFPATVKQSESSEINIEADEVWRYINANGIAQHYVGRFPNRGNPHSIQTQNYHYKVPLNPQVANNITSANGYVFGVAVNGVVFDPGAAEFYKGVHRSIWQYDALSGAVELGFDENHAHVQPSGAYHYHGLPTLLLNELGNSVEQHSALVGWAADGFPIYALYGFSDEQNLKSDIAELKSAYQLKAGQRPSGGSNPGGYYDGTFVADYEYVAGLSSLDECNGKKTVTPEFPGGTYAYFLTRDFPIVPRCFKGQPESEFRKRHE